MRDNEKMWKLFMVHRGHKVNIVSYGDEDNPANVSLECETCGTVILDAELYTICAREEEHQEANFCKVMKIANQYHSTDKYILKEEYSGFGIYQEKTPTGYYMSQSYLITDTNLTIVCQSYNRICLDELKDAIDHYRKTKRFGFRAMNRGEHLYFVHPNGKQSI